MAKLDIKIPTLDLPDGNSIPMIGYGTGTAWYKSDPDAPLNQDCVDGITTAIKVGYNHLDCAEMYNTEAEMGKALKKAKIDRGKFFITTKVLRDMGNVHASLDASLKKLGLDYVDLYLIHSPYFADGDEKKLQDAWAQMEEVAALGKAKSIGVSNFLKPDLNAILKTCRVRPAINQIEFHPYLQHGNLLDFLKNQDIKVEAYSPQIPVTKAKGGPLDQYLESLSKKYAVSPGEVLLRWCVDQNVVPVTTSSKEQRLSDMLRIFTFSLTPKEVQEISDIGNKHHFRAYWTDKFDKDDRS